MDEPTFARPEILDALLARAQGGAPLLLTGPPGAGKTTLLTALGTALARQGWIVCALDLMGAASSPERFVHAALGALPAGPLAARMGDALEIQRLASAGRLNGESAVRALFSLWASLDEVGGRPVALLLDEASEIRSLAYFPGLREVAKPFHAALTARRRGTILATSFPTLAKKLGVLETLDLAPLQAAHLAPYVSPRIAADVVRLSFGWPRYARVLVESVRDGDEVVTAFVSQLRLGGRLEVVLRATYESLLLRSRGYGSSKALLGMIAEKPGQNLTSLYREMGRSPGATRDYLVWLVEVDAVRMVGKRYHYVDGLLAHWVRLHARGRLPTLAEIEATALEILGGDREPRAAEPKRAGELLMEID